MQIKCEKCNKCFKPNEQARLIAESIKDGLPMIMVDCTLCYHHFPLYLKNYKAEIEGIFCPTQGCYGLVTDINIDGKNILGCGSCGNVWNTKKDLDNTITAIINKFPYREECYTLVNGTYENANVNIALYEDKIIKELFTK